MIALVLALAGMEALARAAFEFPLYDADGEVGYWLRPNQSGSFLFINDWAFDSDSLGVAEEFQPSEKLDVLLVGDSVVYGGNGLRQRDKLGPVLEAETGWQVWPAAAGSWGLQNELAFLRRDPKLVQGSDAIVFVLNHADFAETSAWRSPLTHPRERPTLFLPYLLKRYVLKPAPGPSPFPVAQHDVAAEWATFVRRVGKPVFVVAYSDMTQAAQNCRWAPDAFRNSAQWSCFDGMEAVGPTGFRDQIHPSALGNQALAEHIEMAISRGLATSARAN